MSLPGAHGKNSLTVKIALVYPDDFSIWLFRKGLIRSLIRRGHDVYTIAADTGYVKQLEDLGVKHLTIPMERFISPLKDIRVFLQLLKIFRNEHFDIIHNFTVKPNIYGAFAGALNACPLILNSVTGLGYLYREPWEKKIKTRFLKSVIRFLYRYASGFAHRTWFQNSDDAEYFIEKRLISPDKTVVIRSSGINLSEWFGDDQDKTKGLKGELGFKQDDILVVMISRALKSKGVLELMEASRQLASRYPKVKFLLVGGAEEDLNLGVPSIQLKKEALDGHFYWLGHRKDIREILMVSDICVLPSYYREGVPRCLLEAMAMQKPIITTDSVGCREVIEDCVNGYMIPVRDASALAKALDKLILNEALRHYMGIASRKKVENEFDEQIIVDALLKNLYKIPQSDQFVSCY